MTIQIPQASRQAACDAIVDLCEGGTPPALVIIYTGTAPDPDSAATGTVLATLTTSNPAFGAADTDGIATASAITGDTSADDTGIAGYFRVITGTSFANVYQGSCGDPASGADMEISPSASITAGLPVEISALTLQVPQDQS